MIRSWVFDVDDTLYLERDYVRSGFEAVSVWLEVNLGLTRFFDEAWELFMGGVRGNVFDVALERLGHTPEPHIIAQLVSVYREHRPQIRLLPDAALALRHASSHGIVGIITDGPLTSQTAKVEALTRGAKVDFVIPTATLGPDCGKPSLAAFLRFQDLSGTSGSECIYIADNPKKDFVAPKALGWRAARVRRPGSLHFQVPTPEGVDVEGGDLEEVLRQLGVI